ncbi:MAG: BirA family biotin operon repressor/biotin-[acetyl-CoA-carboxylase] ligase [Saprospiraceae bacterium]|jgi:BirA family biotin operon repressor/biotin-[acetyl-CoA-carboxylase] ligase
MINTVEIIRLEEVDSTNEYMKRLYSGQSLQHGLVVVANKQTMGKGQLGKVWESKEKENLLFTFFSSEKKGKTKEEFSFLVSIALLELIKEYLPQEDITIKWPNDLLVDGKKIAGILIENRFRGDSIEASFVGVGMNVNQSVFPRFTRQGCSFKSITGEQFDVYLLAKKLQHLFFLNAKKSKKEIKRSYDKSLYLVGQKSCFLLRGSQVFLTIIKVNTKGQLVTRNEKGELLEFNVGELKYLS